MGMSIGIAAAVAVLAFLIWRKMVPSIDALVDQAVGSKDLSEVLAAIQKRPEAAQPNAYNHGIRRLWDAYHRELALELLRHLAQNYGTARITQYWLKQVQQVEPALTKERLGKEFLDTYYLPELAAQCGPVG